MHHDVPSAPPFCLDDPAWTECGDRGSADFGEVFFRPAAGGGHVLSFDADGRRHALTLFAPGPPPSHVVIYGRRFRVSPAFFGQGGG